MVEVIRIGKMDGDELEIVNVLSPAERKELLLSFGKLKEQAIARNPAYVRPTGKEERFYARSSDFSLLYWFASARRRDDWAQHTGGHVVNSPSLEETWLAIPWRYSDKHYYAKSADGKVYRFVSIVSRDRWIDEHGGSVLMPTDQEAGGSIWG